ncbi:MAG: hypothetical protein KAW84_04400 [Thermoplasmata archaeon]|nr:hypothetical protein [Thermoplasmata archaeon]
MARGFDHSRRLVLIPCSGKKGNGPEAFESERTVFDFLDDLNGSLIREGRSLCSDDVDIRSGEISALVRYEGTLYIVDPALKRQLAHMIETDGLHVLIISASYGLLRPEERIHLYNATMQKRLRVWGRRVPMAIEDYVRRQGIREVYGFFGKSTAYMSVVRRVPWSQMAEEGAIEEVRLFHPENCPRPALRTVPEACGIALSRLVDSEFNPMTLPEGESVGRGTVAYLRYGT